MKNIQKLIFMLIITLFIFGNNSIINAEETNKEDIKFVKGELKNLKNEIINDTILKQNEKYFLYKKYNNTVIQVFNDKNEIISNNSNEFLQDKFRGYVSLFQNISKVNQFYKEKFARYGEIGEKKQGPSFLNCAINNSTPNAVWTGNSLVVNSKYVGISDVLAHEYTHGIIQNEVGKLHFSNETGALEESLADVFATMYDGNYTIGEKLGEENIIRSLSNPEKYNQPKEMKNYVHTSNDKGGVHINNGIPNYAYYLTVKKLGKEKAEKIYYYNLKNNFDENDDFTSFKNDLADSASTIYSQEDAKKIQSIWNKVGVK